MRPAGDNGFLVRLADLLLGAKKVKDTAVNSPSRELRYTEVVNREIQSGNLRQPIWQAALAEAGGDEARAKTAYQTARVAQMLEDEERFETKHISRESIRVKSEEKAIAKEWGYGWWIAIGLEILVFLALAIRYYLEVYLETGTL